MKNHTAMRFVSFTLLLSLCLGVLSGCGDAPESSSPEGNAAHVTEDGYYMHEGHISRVEYPMSADSIGWAAYVFRSVYDMYLSGKDSSIYLSVIPDKNMFLAPDAGVDSMDYEEFYAAVYEQTGFMTPIEIRDKLSLSDYYTTDSHWRQECIVDVAQHIAASMGVSLPTDYETVTLDSGFTGAYRKYFADSVETESLQYLTNDTIESFIVRDLGSNKRMEVYDLALAEGSDPYSMFLGGAMSLITIENPNADTDRELIIFRDSFGSAIAPLLAQGYAKTTIIDLRYITATYMGNFVSFDNQDVLFLHSTLLLNSSAGLKK